MSEIKGQLLGIIIVLMVFAAVGGTMVAVFGNFTKTIETTVSEVVNEEISEGLDYSKSSYTTSEASSSNSNSYPPGVL